MEKRISFIKQLTDILVSQNSIDQKKAEDIKKALKDMENVPLEEYLLQNAFVTKSDLLKALSVYYKVPAFDVSGYLFEHELLREFPKDVLLRNRIIPIIIDQDILVVATPDPSDESLLVTIGRFVNNDVRFNVGISSDIKDAIEEFYDKSITTVDAQDPYFEYLERDDLRKKSLEEEEEKE
ncbi:hypothetical protein M1446_01105 [Candidatus Dependentiae bacterium]|nr:hypothetical protein [Candidatus Dependentiae bacterium]